MIQIYNYQRWCGTEQQLPKGRVKQAQQDKTDCEETSLTYFTSQTLPFPSRFYSSFNSNKYISG